MTDLRKLVKRKTITPFGHRGRRLVIMLMPGDVIGIKEERCHRVYGAPASKVFSVLVRWNVEAERAAKKAAKRSKKKSI